MLEEHVASRLLRTNPDSVVRDDCTRRWWHFELFRREFQDGSERGRLRNTQSEGKCIGSVRNYIALAGTHTLKGSFGSEVRVILKVTFVALEWRMYQWQPDPDVLGNPTYAIVHSLSLYFALNKLPRCAKVVCLIFCFSATGCSTFWCPRKTTSPGYCVQHLKIQSGHTDKEVGS